MRMTQEQGEAIYAMALAQQEARAVAMPTEQDALHQLTQAYHRLTELGWSNPIYCPKDGSPFDVIEAGSSSIHPASYWGEWPTGGWFAHDGGDSYPSRPTLYRPTEAEIAKCDELRAAFAAGGSNA